MAAKKKTLTKYQRMVKAQASYCKGESKKSTVNKAVAAYKKDAAKKGKSKTDISKVVSKATGKCKVVKKKSTKRRKKRA